MSLLSDLKPRRHSIGLKLFAGFLAMGLMTVVLGGYGIFVLSAAGGIVADTYDGTLMAINFARAASLDFAQMDKEVLRRRTAPEAQRPEIDSKIDMLSDGFSQDLTIAEQRSPGEKERGEAAHIRDAVRRWNDLRHQPVTAEREGEIDKVAVEVIDGFDRLIELNADQSFIARRRAISAIDDFRYASILLCGLAVLIGVIVTLLLARNIVRPLTAAARVADRIADGELQTPIPSGGKDETGALLRSMTVMQDNIREMMQQEVSQRRSAQGRLIDALESAHEGIILVDAAGRIVLANRQVADFFPTVAAYIGNGADFAFAFSMVRRLLDWHGDFDDVAGIFAERSSTEAAFSVGEYQLLDGRWIRLSRSDTSDGGFFLSLIDFTEIKEREEHFKEAKLQADAANTAKSNFLANMSHELRTPLNAIIGFSEIINGEMFGSIGNPTYLDYSGDVLRSGRHLLEIINSILDIAKSDAGKLELRAEDLDLRDVICDCAKMMREMTTRAELRLDLPLLETPLPVHGEAAKLRQIILNLMSNAVKFNEPGGTVSVWAGPGKPGMIELRITDTGIGMSPSDIVVAMTPFGQVDSSLGRRYPGTGLGLPLTKALVELHGGTIAIASTPGRGTTVTVSIPNAAMVAPPDESTIFSVDREAV
jgi:signal transduction histidine kinase/HAMP domain-containing protein